MCFRRRVTLRKASEKSSGRSRLVILAPARSAVGVTGNEPGWPRPNVWFACCPKTFGRAVVNAI
jgi:hypothetical protein